MSSILTLILSVTSKVRATLRCLKSQVSLASYLGLCAPTLGLLFMGLVACESGLPSDTKSNGRAVGSPRGLALLDHHVRGRLLDADDAATGSFSFATLAGPEVFELRDLLGRNFGNGQSSGTELNPFSLLAWQRVIDEWAFVLGESCELRQEPHESFVTFSANQRFKLLPAFAASLKTICQESAATPRSRALSNTWNLVVGYGFSEDRDHFVNHFTPLPAGSTTVKAMFWALMMHPDFFLEL